jgi:DNA polymerase-3 subunit epsilon
MSRQIVLDTETTGLSAIDGDRLIELGCVELVNRKLTGNNLHLYFNAGRDSHPDAARARHHHGVPQGQAALRGKDRRDLGVSAGAELIIHNAPFDLGFLNNELKLAKRPPLKQCVGGVLDTWSWPRRCIRASATRWTRCAIVWVSTIPTARCTALLDAELLADVYINLTRGQDALLMTEEPADARPGR